MDMYITDALTARIICLSGVKLLFVDSKESLRPCIDYRGLNDITVKNPLYPLPLIASAFELLQGPTSFTKLDLHDAYLLFRIDRGTSRRLEGSFGFIAGHTSAGPGLWKSPSSICRPVSPPPQSPAS